MQVAEATPFESVTTAIVLSLFEKWHEGPVDGTEKSTRTLGATLPWESRTVVRIVAPLVVAWMELPGGAITAP